MTVYLIHFKEKFSHAQHYIGFVEKDQNLSRRMRHHSAGNGAKLMRHVTEAKIEWEVVRTWKDADRNFERRLKNQHNSACICPICNPQSAMKNMAWRN